LESSTKCCFDKILENGAVFGEVGIFSENEVRTSSAFSEEDSELYSLTSEKAVELFYQDPSFGFYIVRALARYVSEGVDFTSSQGHKNEIFPGVSSGNTALSVTK
jgi:CRP/FNR family transcriptional regulator, cyclic AMP receptor protein